MEERALFACAYLRLSFSRFGFLSDPFGIASGAIALVSAVLRFPSCVP
jgi:hypothetical protein